MALMVNRVSRVFQGLMELDFKVRLDHQGSLEPMERTAKMERRENLGNEGRGDSQESRGRLVRTATKASPDLLGLPDLHLHQARVLQVSPLLPLLCTSASHSTAI